jgi:hypothetical protein
MKTQKIIFLVIFAFALATGLQCHSQTEVGVNTLGEVLPYIDSSNVNNENTDVSNQNKSPVDDYNSENQNKCVGTVYWVNLPLQEVYTYNISTNRPNVVIIYCSRNGYDFIYFPGARQALCDDWYYWRWVTYSSYSAFYHSFPFFRPGVNRLCTNLNFWYRGNYDNRYRYRYGGNYSRWHGQNNSGYMRGGRGSYQTQGYSFGSPGGGSRSNESHSNGGGHTLSTR